MKVNPLVKLTIEEVVALRVTRVQPGIIRRRERTVAGLVAVENKGTRIFLLLPSCRYTEVWNGKTIRKYAEGKLRKAFLSPIPIRVARSRDNVTPEIDRCA